MYLAFAKDAGPVKGYLHCWEIMQRERRFMLPHRRGKGREGTRREVKGRTREMESGSKGAENGGAIGMKGRSGKGSWR